MTPRQARSAALSAVAMLAALTALVLVADGRPVGPDQWAADLGSGGRLAGAVTQLGSGAVLYPALALLAWARLRRGLARGAALAPLAALAVAQVLEAVLFVTVDRVGPDGGPIAFSSGHAMAATLGWGLVAREVRSRWAAAAAALCALAVGLTRLALGVHWLSDVAAGWLLGVIALVIADHQLRVGSQSAQTRADDPAVTTRRHRDSPRAWLLTGAAAAFAVVPLLIEPAATRMKDLLVYVGAGASAGAGRDVYEFRTAYDMPFTYPPFAALLSEPLSRIPLGLLQVLWVAGTLGALYAVARIAMAPVVARIGLPTTLALLLVSSPVRSHLRFGQIGVLLALLLAADLLRAHARQGLGVGVAVALKLTPGVFVPWLLLRRDRRAAVTSVVVAGALTTAALLLLWPSAHEYLWRAFWDSDRFGANDIPGNQSVRGMLLRTGLPDAAVRVSWLGAAAALVVVGTRNALMLDRAGNRLAAVGVLAALSIAVSPISWVHHLVLLVFALSALVAAGRERLAVMWALVLVVSLPAIAAAGLRNGSGVEALWHVLMSAQGGTAVAAVVLLPRLVRERASTSRSRGAGSGTTRRRVLAGVPTAVVVLAGVLGVTATGAVLAMTREGAGVTVDSGEYLSVADGLAHGHGYSMPYLSYSEPYPAVVDPQQRTPMTQYPPGYPTVVAAGQVMTGGSPEKVARWVNAIALGLTTAAATLVIGTTTGSVLWAALAGALLIRPPMVFAHARLLSEPLALLALVATLALTLRQLRAPSRITLTALAAAAAAGTLVRFPGLVAAGSAGLALLLCRDTPTRRRWVEASLVMLAGAVPLAAWFLRNAVVAGEVSDKGLAWHWPTTRAWSTAVDRWLGWVGPHDGVAQIVSAVPLVALAGWLVVAAWRGRRRLRAAVPGLPGLCTLFALAYIFFVVAVRTLLDANLSFGSRMMLPVLLLATVGVTAAAARLPRRGQAVVGIVLCAVLVRSTSALVGTNIPSFPGHASAGYGAERWLTSPSLRYVEALPADVLVVTNAPDAVWLHTRRPTLFVPLRTDLYRASANARFDNHVAALRAAIEGRDSLVVFFDHPTRKGRVRTIDPALVTALDLVPLTRLADASLYTSRRRTQ